MQNKHKIDIHPSKTTNRMNSLEQKIYNPWNPQNKEIPKKVVVSILKTYGISNHVKHVEHFQQACVHTSYANHSKDTPQEEIMEIAPKPEDCMDLKPQDNEELEFVGDSVLGNVVALYLFKRYRGQGEGFMTKMKIRIVNNNMLGDLAKKMGLGEWLIISRHVEQNCNGRNNLRILGSMLEAWIGALYFDQGCSAKGFEAVENFIINIIETHIDFTNLIVEDINFKDQLLRYFQAKYHQPPRYQEIAAVGPIHDRIFTMGVLNIHDEVIAQYSAKNKKVAEQEASRLALEYLEHQDEHQRV